MIQKLFNVPEIQNLGIGASGLTLASIQPGQVSEILIAVVTVVTQLVHLFKRKKKNIPQ